MSKYKAAKDYLLSKNWQISVYTSEGKDENETKEIEDYEKRQQKNRSFSEEKLKDIDLDKDD